MRSFAIAAIGLEASGGYERGAMRAVLAAGLPACPVNPFKLRQFARASGVSGQERSARYAHDRVVPPAIERLAEMLAVRRQLNAEKVAAANASRLLEDAMLQRLLRRRIARFAADIDMLDRHLVEIVETDAALAHAPDCSP